MLKRALYHVARLAIIATALSVFTVAYLNWRGTPLIVENATGGVLDAVLLRSSSCGGNSDYALGALAPSQSRTVRVKICGEGDAEVLATLPGGRVVSGRAGYITAGSTQRYVVMDNKIQVVHGYAP